MYVYVNVYDNERAKNFVRTVCRIAPTYTGARKVVNIGHFCKLQVLEVPSFAGGTLSTHGQTPWETK